MTTQQPILTNVNLDLINVSKTNKLFRDAAEMKDAELLELAESIKVTGVIQSILLRPDPDAPGMYRLVSGERRVKGSALAGKKDIPAQIREMTEAEAFAAQMIENVQRKNIHPLREAKGYKLILDNDPNITVQDLALQVGKSETYIVQRLKLNDLIGEAKKDFLTNKMTISHAVLIARLSPALQKECIQESVSRLGYGTVAELQEYINRQIINILSAAPFSKDDATLVPKAGACSMCPKRSGSSPMLFSDIKETDRCTDRICFQNKCMTHLVNKTKEVIETQPDVVILKSYSDPAEEVQKIVDDHNVKILKEYNDFNSNDKDGTKVKGLWISGKDAGKITSIYIRRAKEAAEAGTANQQVLITKIRERITRARELDQEKVYAKILNALSEHPSTKKATAKKMIPEEEVFLWYIILDKAGYTLRGELKRMLHATTDNPEKLFNALANITPEQKAIMVRKVMLDQYGGNYPTHDHAYITRRIAESYKDIPIKEFETEQEEIRNKREARAKDKIKVIKSQE